jgi:hypothetical protein
VNNFAIIQKYYNTARKKKSYTKISKENQGGIVRISYKQQYPKPVDTPGHLICGSQVRPLHGSPLSQTFTADLMLHGTAQNRGGFSFSPGGNLEAPGHTGKEGFRILL